MKIELYKQLDDLATTLSPSLTARAIALIERIGQETNGKHYADNYECKIEQNTHEPIGKAIWISFNVKDRTRWINEHIDSCDSFTFNLFEDASMDCTDYRVAGSNRYSENDYTIEIVPSLFGRL